MFPWIENFDSSKAWRIMRAVHGKMNDICVYVLSRKRQIDYYYACIAVCSTRQYKRSLSSWGAVVTYYMHIMYITKQSRKSIFHQLRVFPSRFFRWTDETIAVVSFLAKEIVANVKIKSLKVIKRIIARKKVFLFLISVSL